MASPMRRSIPSNFFQLIRMCVRACVVLAFGVVTSNADDLVLTPDVPIDQFQNRHGGKPYNFDAPPEGMFRTIAVAEGFDEEVGYRRQTEIVPLNPTEEFRSQAKPVFIVFQLYQHFQSFKIFALCYPEEAVSGDPEKAVATDTALITLEDESGYLRLLPPAGGWKAGKYKVEIHVGEAVNNISLVGTVRFTVVAMQSQEAHSQAFSTQ